MRDVYEHLATGDFYVVERGDLGHQVNLQGERTFTLVPPRAVTIAATGLPVEHAEGTWLYKVLDEAIALSLTVSMGELTTGFRLRPDLHPALNSPIEDLLAEYTAECCDFKNLRWVAQVGQRTASNMTDSLSRCLMHTLAGEVAARQEEGPLGDSQ